MMRVCNLDTCPVGVATQNPSSGPASPASRSTWSTSCDFVAQELREYMAALGIRTVDELVGRSDLLTGSGRSW